MRNFCAAKLAKSVKYACSSFFPNTGENYARDKELGQNLC